MSNVFVDKHGKKHLFPEGGYILSRHFDGLHKFESMQADADKFVIIFSYRSELSNVEDNNFHLIPADVYNSNEFREQVVERNPKGIFYADPTELDSSYSAEVEDFCQKNGESIRTYSDGGRTGIFPQKSIDIKPRHIIAAILIFIFVALISPCVNPF